MLSRRFSAKVAVSATLIVASSSSSSVNAVRMNARSPSPSKVGRRPASWTRRAPDVNRQPDELEVAFKNAPHTPRAPRGGAAASSQRSRSPPRTPVNAPARNDEWVQVGIDDEDDTSPAFQTPVPNGGPRVPVTPQAPRAETVVLELGEFTDLDDDDFMLTVPPAPWGYDTSSLPVFSNWQLDDVDLDALFTTPVKEQKGDDADDIAALSTATGGGANGADESAVSALSASSSTGSTEEAPMSPSTPRDRVNTAEPTTPPGAPKLGHLVEPKEDWEILAMEGAEEFARRHRY